VLKYTHPKRQTHREVGAQSYGSERTTDRQAAEIQISAVFVLTARLWRLAAKILQTRVGYSAQISMLFKPIYLFFSVYK
jgi:hypothetical protein